MENNAELIAAAVAVLTALAAYIKNRADVASIQNDRAETKTARDADTQQLRERVSNLEVRANISKETSDKLFEKMDKIENKVAAMASEVVENTVKLDNLAQLIRGNQP